ncbi:hypothetical protein ACRCPT_06325 [Pseudomonas aeruginosa]|uniref:Uncharacterized protein n=2 Tax=Pseudomonadaceae TaxID=135621 RepID=A0A1L7NMX4_PSEPU|nr:MULTISPECIES: hypothetical protein [Pseudomonas]OWG38551.1 hypothetical protein CAQ69_10435 [Stutzerimonas stutzeri]KSC76957.1 hypothetical protein AO888_03090 [Pseudomonas aeruginosa]MCR7873119.1 hypothetical protein [Pseudomonas aeruginosa]MDR8015384.1 hypothetical protein [Pseudomonas guguanensis]BAW26792.1 Uncharacterized protein KF715C_pA2870 [Pseudomonas putida]
MSIGFATMDNDLFYQPEDGFWTGCDKLSFEADRLQAEWPQPTNPFVRRMASQLAQKRSFHNVALDDFNQMVGCLLSEAPGMVYRFILVPMGPLGTHFSLKLIQSSTSLPPLLSDNICSIRLATGWMAKRFDHFEISCASGGCYWVHKR